MDHTQWVSNWLNGTQRIVVNGPMFRWRLARNAILKGSVMRLVLFNVLVGDMDEALNAPSATLLMTLSCIMWLTCWREGMPARDRK